MRTVYLSPLLGAYKVFILAGADRLGPEAANAFLKTLEEPPNGSLLILLTSDPDKVLETIRSRCLRVNIGMGQGVGFSPDQQDWILNFSKIATESKQGLLARYQLLSPLVEWLKKRHELIKKQLEAESPLKLSVELEPAAKERFKKELDAAIEAEYRRERSEQLKLIQWWLRDIWLSCLGNDNASFRFPTAADYTRIVSARISSRQARQNLDQFETTQGLLQTNVQEGLTLEVGLLKLNL
jgi:DNA polymerase-3 subunit delta'